MITSNGNVFRWNLFRRAYITYRSIHKSTSTFAHIVWQMGALFSQGRGAASSAKWSTSTTLSVDSQSDRHRKSWWKPGTMPRHITLTTSLDGAGEFMALWYWTRNLSYHHSETIYSLTSPVHENVGYILPSSGRFLNHARLPWAEATIHVQKQKTIFNTVAQRWWFPASAIHNWFHLIWSTTLPIRVAVHHLNCEGWSRFWSFRKLFRIISYSPPLTFTSIWIMWHSMSRIIISGFTKSVRAWLEY